MSKQITSLDFLMDLSIEEQQLLAGGQDTPGGLPADLEEPDEELIEPDELPEREDRRGGRGGRSQRR